MKGILPVVLLLQVASLAFAPRGIALGSRTTPPATGSIPKGALLLGIICPGASRCLAVGQSGTILAGTGEGATWSPQASGTTHWLQGVACPSVRRCLAVGQSGTILASTNEGATWGPQASGTTHWLHSVTCPSAHRCLAAGQGGTILVSKDAGATWSHLASGTTNELNGITCFSATCLAVGEGDIILSSADGGVTWSSQYYQTVPRTLLQGVTCLSATRCLAVGWNGVIVTTDGGIHWSKSTTLVSGTSISCPNATRCWTAGPDSIQASTDGGASWASQTPGTLDWLSGISCPNPTLCLAVGQDSTILVSSGGANWTSESSGSSRPLQGTTCLMANECMALGGVPRVYAEMQRVAARLVGPLHLEVDQQDTWPWAFYLGDPSRFWVDAYPYGAADFQAAEEPVLIVGAGTGPGSTDNYAAVASALSARYTAFRESFSWWNPEKCEPRTKGCEIQIVFWFLVRKPYVLYLSADYRAMAKAEAAKSLAQNPFRRAIKTLRPLHTYAASPQSFTDAGPVASTASGDVLVADEANCRIVELSPSGALVRVWGSPGTGQGQFNCPSNPSIGGIAVGPHGNVYVTDTWNCRVQEFSPSGAFIRMWGQANLYQTNLKPDDFYGARGIAVGPDGNVYVADTGHERVQVFTATGSFVRSIGKPGTMPGEFDEPSSVAIDASGGIFIADFWNSRVQVFTSTGTYRSSFKVAVWQRGSRDEPLIAVDSMDRVYVPDTGGGNVLVYSSEGKPLYEWGDAGSTALFVQPQFVAAGLAGDLVVSDSGSNIISSFGA